MFVSFGLLCAFRSAKVNLMEKQNILHQNWVKSELDRKSHFFDNDSCTSGTLSTPPVMSIGSISVVCTLGQNDVYLRYTY